MNTKRHFIYTKIKSRIDRTYGGENYTLAVYENKGRGKIVRIGEISKCSRSHKGEPSEAWGVAFDSLSKREQNRLRKLSSDGRNGPGMNQYWLSWEMEKIGYMLTEL